MPCFLGLRDEGGQGWWWGFTTSLESQRKFLKHGTAFEDCWASMLLVNQSTETQVLLKKVVESIFPPRRLRPSSG